MRQRKIKNILSGFITTSVRILKPFFSRLLVAMPVFVSKFYYAVSLPVNISSQNRDRCFPQQLNCSEHIGALKGNIANSKFSKRNATALQ